MDINQEKEHSTINCGEAQQSNAQIIESSFDSESHKLSIIWKWPKSRLDIEEKKEETPDNNKNYSEIRKKSNYVLNPACRESGSSEGLNS